VLDISIKESSAGTGHIIYFVETDKWPLVYRGTVWLEDAEYYMSLEEQFIQQCKEADIPTSNIIASDTSRSVYNFDYQIMSILPWSDLETERVGTKEQYDKISKELGKMAALEYKMPVQDRWRFTNSNTELIWAKNTAFDYLTAYLDYDLWVIEANDILDAAACNYIKEFFQQHKDMINEQQQAYLVHHDLADHNIRYDTDTYSINALYDRENAVWFDPICEVWSAPTRSCHYPRLELMKAGFLQELWYVPPHFEEKINIYLLRTIIWKMAFAIKWNRFKLKHQQIMNTAIERNNLEIDWPYSTIGTMEL
jgi:hypothetical protein